MSNIKTYGEAYIAVKRHMNLVDGKWKSIKLPKHKERMKRKPAAKYYGAKIEAWFKSNKV